MSTIATATQDRISIIDENLKERYARVPRPVMKAKGLSFRAKCIYCLLLDYARENDSCFPGQEVMADDLDTSVDTIQRGLQELREYGLIDWKRRGYNQPNVYYILRLSDCPKLRIVQPTRKPDTAAMPPRTPQNCGNTTPQNCGSNETKSKETQLNETNSSKNAWSEEDELKRTYSHVAHGTIGKTEEATGKAPSSLNTESTSHMNPFPPNRAGESKNENSRFGETGRPPLQSFKKAQQQQERPPVFVGKPITQDEIDAKKREGKNASGYTPLANIPPEHWQKLENDARNAPIKPTATHYNNSTRNAPMFIDSTIEEFSTLLGDDTANTAQNINRAAKLYRQSGLSEDEFRALMHDSFNQAKRYPTTSVKKKRPDGRPNRMPVFFGILEDRAAQA